MKTSKGEQVIINLLRKDGLKFEREKEFADLRGGRYRYDFYLPALGVLIEYDGEQHFQRVSLFQKTQRDFLKTKGHDRQKNEYALTHNLRLYRIPYWELDSLTSSRDIFQQKFEVRSIWHNDDLWRKHENRIQSVIFYYLTTETRRRGRQLDFFEVVKNIGSLLGLFLSITSVVGIVAKFQNKRYKELFDEHSKEIRKNDKKQTEEITEIKNTLNNLETKFDNLETKVDGLEKRSDVDEDFNAEICRNVIKDIYYKYNKTQKIPLYERKMADSLYKIYSEQFHQNSYGQLLYQEICKWEIDTTDKLTM